MSETIATALKCLVAAVLVITLGIFTLAPSMENRALTSGKAMNSVGGGAGGITGTAPGAATGGPTAVPNSKTAITVP